MPMNATRWMALGLVLAGLSCTMQVRAAEDTPDPDSASEDNVERARELATRAGDLLDQKLYDQALELIDQAEELYHAPTHLLFKGEALALVSRVPSVLVVIRGEPAQPPTTTVDGEIVELKPGVAMRLDPGEHLIRVEARGFEPYEQQLTLLEKGGVVKLEVVLDPIADPADAEPGVPAIGQAATPADVPAEPRPTAKKGLRAPELIAFGVGVVGLGVGGVTGVMSMQAVNDLKDRCPDDACPPTEQSDIDRARGLGNVATVAFIAGGVAITTGVLIRLLRGKGEKHAARNQPRWLVVGGSGVGSRF